MSGLSRHIAGFSRRASTPARILPVRRPNHFRTTPQPTAGLTSRAVAIAAAFGVRAAGEKTHEVSDL